MESQQPQVKIRKTYWVEYAHRLQSHEGKCRFLHGHSGKVEFTFQGLVDSTTGMVYDFGEFRWLQTIVEEFDHALVLQNDDPVLACLLVGVDKNDYELNLMVLSCPPTAENISLYLKCKIYNYVKANIGRCLKLVSIKFEETRKNEVEWSVGDEL